tara:strand:+ start:504 stop:851 length:348 start_codon:yes stop_codon:yes gene_type:complete
MNLTENQLAVLNHVVNDGQAWADNTTEENMLAKVAKYEASYLSEKDNVDYKTSQDKMDAEAAVEQERYDNVTYDVKRIREYPSIGDQLDALYHAGVFPADMAAELEAIKAKYPKS